MIDSMTGFTHATPVRSKNQHQLMVQELCYFLSIDGPCCHYFEMRQRTGLGSMVSEDSQCKVIPWSCHTGINTHGLFTFKQAC